LFWSSNTPEVYVTVVSPFFRHWAVTRKQYKL